MRVDFEHNKGYHNLYITPSVEDYQNADGICGHIQQDQVVVRRYRDGTTAPNYVDFAKDW